MKKTLVECYSDGIYFQHSKNDGVYECFVMMDTGLDNIIKWFVDIISLSNFPRLLNFLVRILIRFQLYTLFDK
jgi:hypothetical protein